MRNYISILCFFGLLCGCNNIESQATEAGIIKFEYVGESDKPIWSIFLTMDKVSNEDTGFVTFVHISGETYSVIKDFVESKEKVSLMKNEESAILVSIQTGRENKEYALLSRQRAVSYLHALNHQLETDDRLNKNDISEIVKNTNIMIKRLNG